MYRILSAYDDDPETFNREVAAYQTNLEANPPHGYDAERVEFESFFNHAQLFFRAWILYVVAFLISCLGFLFWFWQEPIGRAAFWLLVLLLVVHTLALAGRVMISGRPPVTNLYSSALFIGWSGVVFGLVLQAIFRLGIGNLIASLAGMSTLHIAYQLGGDGDTFKVMQAVLDTNFWLTTHVLTIALGYAATFVAGFLGVLYILTGTFTPHLQKRLGEVLLGVPAALADKRVAEIMQKMIYGVLCFALFFSFIGTVLGGLWADDSWGRFWGWDPKENGALIIVLWNALVLHAAWGGMIQERGLAVLAVGGNICTAWSWFGVNELGVGLHSYGFTEGVLSRLAVFVAVQAVCIGIGLLPLSWWWSYRRRPDEPN
jgi:ABC-type transport system involved in cytochrome c biogenesis permease subunit